jgi:hypothetical protein
VVVQELQLGPRPAQAPPHDPRLALVQQLGLELPRAEREPMSQPASGLLPAN